MLEVDNLISEKCFIRQAGVRMVTPVRGHQLAVDTIHYLLNLPI